MAALSLSGSRRGSRLVVALGRLAQLAHQLAQRRGPAVVQDVPALQAMPRQQVLRAGRRDPRGRPPARRARCWSIAWPGPGGRRSPARADPVAADLDHHAPHPAGPRASSNAPARPGGVTAALKSISGRPAGHGRAAGISTRCRVSSRARRMGSAGSPLRRPASSSSSWTAPRAAPPAARYFSLRVGLQVHQLVGFLAKGIDGVDGASPVAAHEGKA